VVARRVRCDLLFRGGRNCRSGGADAALGIDRLGSSGGHDVPLIASRTEARADLFSTVLIAVYIVLLWRYQQTGRARLWLLPVLMVVWVNAHLGFIVVLE
jgi:hypothetical protein